MTVLGQTSGSQAHGEARVCAPVSLCLSAAACSVPALRQVSREACMLPRLCVTPCVCHCGGGCHHGPVTACACDGIQGSVQTPRS